MGTEFSMQRRSKLLQMMIVASLCSQAFSRTTVSCKVTIAGDTKNKLACSVTLSRQGNFGDASLPTQLRIVYYVKQSGRQDKPISNPLVKRKKGSGYQADGKVVTFSDFTSSTCGKFYSSGRGGGNGLRCAANAPCPKCAPTKALQDLLMSRSRRRLMLRLLASEAASHLCF